MKIMESSIISLKQYERNVMKISKKKRRKLREYETGIKEDDI